MGDYVEILPNQHGLSTQVSVDGMNGVTFQIKSCHVTKLHFYSDDHEFELRFGPTITIHLMRGFEGNFTSGGFNCPQSLSDEWQEYWLSWYNGEINFGLQGSTRPAIVKKAPGLKTVKVIKPDFNALWRFELGPVPPKSVNYTVSGGEPTWVTVEDNIPTGAVVGGHENEPLNIIRASHRGSLAPGKFVASLGTAFVAWGGQAVEKEEFEMLVGYNLKWVACSEGYVPHGALVGGHSEFQNEPLYIGRVHKDGHLIVGKVQPSHRVCYFPYQDVEVASKEYDVLVTEGDSRITLVPTHIDQAEMMRRRHHNRLQFEHSDGSSDSED